MFYNEIYWDLMWGGDKVAAQYSGNLPGKNDTIPFLSKVIIENEFLFENDNLSIVDVGCGQGDLIYGIGQTLTQFHQIKLIGCDYNVNATNISKSKGIDCNVGGIECLINRYQADILILSHVFEHFLDLNRSLDMIEKLTHNNSLIYIEVPGVTDLDNKPEYMYDYQDYTVLAHIHNFSLSTLVNVFSTRGYMLLTGNQYVRSVFRKNVNNAQLVHADPYGEIMTALERAKQKHFTYLKKKNNPILRYGKGLAKALLGRV